jgi:hypothetical protein
MGVDIVSPFAAHVGAGQAGHAAFLPQRCEWLGLELIAEEVRHGQGVILVGGSSAVFAVEIADGPAWLGHEMKGGGVPLCVW